MLDVPPTFAADVRVWQLVLSLVLEFEGPGIDVHVERAHADVTAAARGDAGSHASPSAQAGAARAGHGRDGRQRWFDRDGSQLVGALLYWLGDELVADAARGSRFAASLPSLTPFQVVLWLGVVRQSVLLPRWRSGRGANASSSARPFAQQQLRDAADCAAVARGVVCDNVTGWDALALTVGFADVEAMLGRYILFATSCLVGLTCAARPMSSRARWDCKTSACFTACQQPPGVFLGMRQQRARRKLTNLVVVLGLLRRRKRRPMETCSFARVGHTF